MGSFYDAEKAGEGRAPARSSLRLKYEAQVEIARKQLGDLELIRMKLGLSARKICQLLLVDPSAWSRWTRDGQSAPPHVWRALQWYMMLQEKVPGLSPEYFLGRSTETAALHLKKEMELRYQAIEQGQTLWSGQQKQLLQELKSKLEQAEQSEQQLQMQIQNLEKKVFRVYFSIVLILGIGLFTAALYHLKTSAN